MFCVFCGAANLEVGRFCKACGKPLVKDAGLIGSAPSIQPKSEVRLKPTSSLAAPDICQRQPYRDGKKIVVPTGASLPPYCVKCGSADVTVATKSFSWLNPVYYLLLFLGLGIVLVYLIFRKRVKLSVPLCSSHERYMQRLKVSAMALLLGCIPIGILLGTLVGEPDGDAWGVFAALIMLVAGLVAVHLQIPLQATHIDRDRAVLKGANVAFLTKLSTS
jgi:hypothetical protein